MNYLAPYTYSPELGYHVPSDYPSVDFDEKPERRNRPLGEHIGLAKVSKLIADRHGAERRILRDIDLSIRRGEVLGIVGPSGAGKSTLLRCINLLERPSAGEILYEGEVVQDRAGERLSAHRRRVGVVFKRGNLLATLSAFDNVALPMRLAGRRPWEVLNRVPILLGLVGLEDLGEARPDTLSPVQRRRLGIARALALQPEVLLCEEPTAGLDPVAGQQVLELVRDVNRRSGITVVLTTDDIGVIRAICDRLAVIEAGRIVEEGPVWETYAHPRAELTMRLVQSVMPALPSFIRSRLGPPTSAPSDAILRLSFGGRNAVDPVIAGFARETGAVFSVIHGAIDYIQEQPLGVIFLALQADGPDHLRSLVAYLRPRVLDVEVLGHVARSA